MAFDTAQTGIRNGVLVALRIQGQGGMETFKILARVYPSEPGFTAVVTALPENTSTLAQVRTRSCDSHTEAVKLLQSMTLILRLELLGRGHSVVAIEFPAPTAPELQAWV